MDAVLSNISALGTHPVAWAIVVLLGLKAVVAFLFSLRCPIMRGTAEITPDVIAGAKAFRVGMTPVYFAIMTVGMALSVAGLYMMQDMTYGPFALCALALGLFLLLTEPPRFLVNMAVQNVFASADGDPEVNALARDRLRSALWRRTAYEVCIVAAIACVVFLI